ncbi:MAG TPA: hypothetical protein VMT15_01410 [Bryobacteraceae bacterium]|nr:hypothetical protein [Bryobacteraceae bacterium]
MSVEDGKPVIPHDPHEGFDRREPSSGAIALFAIGSMILLVLTIAAITQYFNHVYDEAVYEKVLSAPSEQLRDVRGRDDWNLTHYMYMNKATGQVRIPVDHAMELMLQDAAAGKTFYPAKATAPKKEEPAAAPTAAPAAGAPGTPAAPAAPEKK